MISEIWVAIINKMVPEQILHMQTLIIREIRDLRSKQYQVNDDSNI